MTENLALNKVCVPSENVVAREIEGEIIIVPLASGIGDAEDELYSLNETGQAIWHQLDGVRTLSEVVDALLEEFEAPRAALETDVIGFSTELLRRGILVEQ